MDRVVQIDGGDLACGELLMRVAAQVRLLTAGTLVRLVATDPAAPIDVPAWCHLTRHEYLGASTEVDGRPCYGVRVSSRPASMHPDKPWQPAGGSISTKGSTP